MRQEKLTKVGGYTQKGGCTRCSLKVPSNPACPISQWKHKVWAYSSISISGTADLSEEVLLSVGLPPVASQPNVKLQRALLLMHHSTTPQTVLSMQLFSRTILFSEKSKVLSMQATHRPFYFNIFFQGCHQKKVVGLPVQLSPCISWIHEKRSKQPCDYQRGLPPQKNRH